MINKNQKKTDELSNSSNIIGKGTIVNGNFEAHGNIRVEGKVVGNVKTKSKVAFGQSSEIEGNVYAQNVEVAGHITGTIEVSEQLVLKSTAIIDGDIITNKLLVETGGILNGKCKMGVKNKEISIGNSEENKRQIFKA